MGSALSRSCSVQRPRCGIRSGANYGSDHWIVLRTKAVETVENSSATKSSTKAGERANSTSTSDLLEFVFHTAHSTAEERPESAPGEVARLSAREPQVADLVVAGMTNQQIAEKLVLSPRTVEDHVEHILQALDLRRRVEIVSMLVR